MGIWVCGWGFGGRVGRAVFQVLWDRSRRRVRRNGGWRVVGGKNGDVRGRGVRGLVSRVALRRGTKVYSKTSF